MPSEAGQSESHGATHAGVVKIFKLQVVPGRLRGEKPSFEGCQNNVVLLNPVRADASPHETLVEMRVNLRHLFRRRGPSRSQRGSSVRPEISEDRDDTPIDQQIDALKRILERDRKSTV